MSKKSRKIIFGVVKTRKNSFSTILGHILAKIEISEKKLLKSTKIAEISAMWQKFLDQNIQNFIPHLFYIHHYALWAAERIKTKNFGKNGRNFCHMPEISKSEYLKSKSASFLYWTYLPEKAPTSQIKKSWG